MILNQIQNKDHAIQEILKSFLFYIVEHPVKFAY